MLNPLRSETYDEYFIERVAEIESEILDPKEKIDNSQFKGKSLEYLKRAENLLLEKGREEEVILLSTKSLEIEKSFIAYFFRAYALGELKKHEKAILDYKNAIQYNDESAPAFNNLGVSFAEIGDNYKAINYYEKAISLDPELAAAYSNTGNSKIILGMRRSGCNDYKKAAYLGSKTALEWIRSSNGYWCRNLR